MLRLPQNPNDSVPFAIYQKLPQRSTASDPRLGVSPSTDLFSGGTSSFAVNEWFIKKERRPSPAQADSRSSIRHRHGGPTFYAVLVPVLILHARAAVGSLSEFRALECL